jgi:RNA:NAD 2'-phosphotransferase (TPT1/KptA family)
LVTKITPAFVTLYGATVALLSLPAMEVTVDAAARHKAGHAFYQAANGVWLTDHVPPGDLSGWPG